MSRSIFELTISRNSAGPLDSPQMEPRSSSFSSERPLSTSSSMSEIAMGKQQTLDRQALMNNHGMKRRNIKNIYFSRIFIYKISF